MPISTPWVMPGVTQLLRYVVQKETAATLEFAAVMAQAARIIKRFNEQLPRLGDSCLAAAKKAWQWAKQFPALAYDRDAMNKQFSSIKSKYCSYQCVSCRRRPKIPALCIAQS